MRKLLFAKLKESFLSVVTIFALVVLLNLTMIEMPRYNMILFIVSVVFMILGISLFNLGVDISLMPIGENVGSALVKTKRLIVIVIVSFLIGVFICVAEPDLHILAAQISGIPDLYIILAVSIGVGIAVVIAFLRILLQIKLSYILMAFYAVAFILSAFTRTNIVSIAFESGGVTTGPIMVPFVMALGLGLSFVRGDKTTEDDSFGLVALCLLCPILTMLILGFMFEPKGGSVLSVPDVLSGKDIFNLYLNGFPEYFKQVAIALAPILILFVIFQIIRLKLSKKTLLRIAVGTIYTYLGLVLFLASANIGFMPTGYLIGVSLTENVSLLAIVIIGLAMGFFVVSAEPAVFVLKEQVENVTDGAISGRALGMGLSIGVALSVGLSVLRIIKGFSILYIVIPGYIFALVMSFFVPPLFTAISFDSGAVASGPLAATFILPFAIGVCEGLGGNIFTDAFGVVAVIALMPVVTMQIFGIIYAIKMRFALKKSAIAQVDDSIIDYDDEQED